MIDRFHLNSFNFLVKVIPNEPGNFGTVYHRGGSYHAVNFNLHTPAEHLFKDDSGGIRPLELFIVHELIGKEERERENTMISFMYVLSRGKRREDTIGVLRHI